MARPIITRPGLVYGNVDPAAPMTLDPAQLPRFLAHGYVWASVQATNGHTSRPVDLEPIRAAGLSPGVWGIFYTSAEFAPMGAELGRRAVAADADHVMVNVEFAAKNTRAARGLRELVDGVRAGGWPGPVHLNTLGHPTDPERHDFAIDHESILETGGGILAQCYGDQAGNYDVDRACRYWRRFMPLDRVNVGVSFYGVNGDVNWPAAVELAASGYGLPRRNLHIYMPQIDATEPRLKGLDTMALAPFTSAESRSAMEDVLRHSAFLGSIDAREVVKQTIRSWRAGFQNPQPDSTRMETVGRVVEAKDPAWLPAPKGVHDAGGRIDQVLDAAGVPRLP